MINPSTTLSTLPPGLRDPLLEEYRSIVQNYFERRWTPSELSGGKFCEIVYTILEGYSRGSYPSGPSKPANFVAACRALESMTGVPRSFQILIPRLLPALYEIRNNRGVGHVGGDVDPNHMDATAVLSAANWIMAELVRVFHTLPVSEAQELVDALVEQRVPLVWQVGKQKRILDPTLGLKEQVLTLLAATSGGASIEEVVAWSESRDRAYFMKTLRGLHKQRFIELDEPSGSIQLLPPGNVFISEYLAKRSGLAVKARRQKKKGHSR